MANVSTTLGEIDEKDLSVQLIEVGGDEMTWTVARECRYIGRAYPRSAGEVVRRDVWVTFKVGQAAQVAAAL
jgi:hypothetical protein